MNALANSQLEELEGFIGQSGVDDRLRPTFARYTGQESESERRGISESKPDILLTNFMMLELLMTRQNPLDQAVIGNANDLDFIVLDELHTYRGRQGADVAMLVRRLKDRLCRGKEPVCIGTSATMASDDAAAEPVAEMASRLFGTRIASDAVIGESLERATDPSQRLATLGAALGEAINARIPDAPSDIALRSHPLAIWIELVIGLNDAQHLARRPPVTLEDAAKRLAEQTGRTSDRCRAQLQAMLIAMSRPAKERGGAGDRRVPGVQAAPVHRRRRPALLHAARAGPAARDAGRPGVRSAGSRCPPVSHPVLPSLWGGISCLPPGRTRRPPSRGCTFDRRVAAE
jgi:hypothetical protein